MRHMGSRFTWGAVEAVFFEPFCNIASLSGEKDERSKIPFFFSFFFYPFIFLFIYYSYYYSPNLIASQLPALHWPHCSHLYFLSRSHGSHLSPRPLASQLPTPPRIPRQQRPRPRVTQQTDGRIPTPR
jgi:hypothetical protein